MTNKALLLGANVPEKSRGFMPYVSGFKTYRDICEKVTANGRDGFELAP